MMEDFKDLVELKDYCQAQYKTIVNQSKKINELESEVEHLKSLLSQTVPIISPETDVSLLITKNEESIAQMELKKLRDTSLSRELTMEEARKTEIYSKILQQVNANKKKKDPGTKDKGTDELLSIVDEGQSS